MNRQTTSIPRIFIAFLYLCGLTLFLEWLYPIEQVTDTSSIAIFIIYAVFCFFISMLQLRWWVSFLLKGFGLLFILNGLYFEMAFLSQEWFNRLVMEMMSNIDILVSQNWYYLSPLFRSFLFLMLIWLMSYLLHYWFVQMKRIFLFIFLTFIYITVLDTFTLYDARLAIIRIFIISLVAMAMTNFNRDLERENISFERIKRKALWVFPLVLTILFSVLIGMAAPKFYPQWPDPVPFIESAAEQVSGSGSGTVRKVGYGEDDSRLGGSFIQDDTPVFQAEASQDHYWRIETKDLYTGKGWETSGESIRSESASNELDLGMFLTSVETEELTANIVFQEGQNFNKLVYPYGVKEVIPPTEDVTFYTDFATEAIETWYNGNEITLSNYQLNYDHPSFSLTALREDQGIDPSEVSPYLQLPDMLPARVGELANEITAAYDTRYEKTRAIERYFSSNGFTYETTGVAVPEEGEDYVDQFLFDTKIGYCDNFSTAMVVMLRTLDIPARWVKGFTGGEAIGEGETAESTIYEITNSNAHSWVEVYFPETGWVSFEPTQGFSNPTEFHVDRDATASETRDDVLEAPEPELPEADAEFEDEEAVAAMADNSGGPFNYNWWQIALVLTVFLAIVFMLYKWRFKLRTKLFDIKLRRTKDQKVFQDAYHHLLAVLDHEGYERKQNQTLREFAKRVDARYQTDEMQVLTKYYERMLYRNEFNSADFGRLRILWKKLMRAITG